MGNRICVRAAQLAATTSEPHGGVDVDAEHPEGPAFGCSAEPPASVNDPGSLAVTVGGSARDRRGVAQGTGAWPARATKQRRILFADEPAVDNGGMSANDDASEAAAPIDTAASPDWLMTGYKFFPYAARQNGQWWVLRMNYDFPEHDLYTIFVDGTATADVSGNPESPVPLAASVAGLRPCAPATDRPTMSAEEAEAVVRPCTPFMVYGSETNNPCDWCDWLTDRNPLQPRDAGPRPPQIVLAMPRTETPPQQVDT